jgi:hypothetical protein
MRIQIRTKGRAQGNVLIVALLTCFILGMGLASYLTLVSSQNYSVMRSLAWNAAIPMVEAGAEEALTQLYHHGNPGTNAAAYLANGWSVSTTSYPGSYAMSRWLDDSYFEVYISPSDPPVIHSHGFVPVPLRSGSPVASFLASLVTDDQTRKTYVRRGVRLTTQSSALFAKGLVADGQINLNGNNITTDSFDSLDPLYSLNGKYPAGILSRLRDKGDVATNSGLVDSLNVGNANIKGYVATGPGGSVAIGPNGVVGDSQWHLSGNQGIQDGFSRDDMNVDFKPVKEPFTSGYSTPSGGTVDGVYYDYIIGPGRNQISNLTGKVLVTGDAVVHVTDSIRFTGNDYLVLAPDTNLQIFMSGETALFGGNGDWNQNGSALNLQYWGLPTNTSVSISGNGSFTGTIYAPQADLTLNGGGRDTYDFVGASISNTAHLGGKVQFHYDEALSRVGPKRGYIVNTWNEI